MGRGLDGPAPPEPQQAQGGTNLMPTATDDKQTETNTYIFRSHDPAYNIVRRPERRRTNDRGELEILPGERFTFENRGGIGELRLDDPPEDVLDWLRGHRSYNS